MLWTSRTPRTWTTRPRSCFLAHLLTALAIAAAAPAAAAEATDEEGFAPLFNRHDLQGWVKEGAAGFRNDEGRIVCDGSGDYPCWLRSEEVFENFVLRFEFRLELYGESGIFLHAPRHGRNSNVGLEVQLSDDTRNSQPVTLSTGAIFGAVPPTKQASRPLGAWNEMEIVCDWPTLRVTLNGEVVQDLNLEEDEELGFRLRRGFLGLQDRGKTVEFRRLRVRRLPDQEVWQQLFSGESFAGWGIVQPEGARWRIDGDEIVAENGNGYLVSEQEWENFELHAYVKTSRLANGGIFFRWKSLVPKDRGYEIQLEDIPDSNNPTGSIYDVVRAKDAPIQPGEWYLLQLRVEGERARVRVNGVTVAECDALSIVRRGHVALQMHKSDSWIRFKDIKIKSLDDAE